MTETLTDCTSKALRQIAASIRLAVSEEVIDVDAVLTGARQLEARAEMIEGDMG